MDLNEAILYFLKKSENSLSSRDYQIAIWLKELREYRELSKNNKLIYDYMYSKNDK